MKYSKSFQQTILRMVLPPENKSIQSVSREMGVSYQSIYNWKRLFEKGELLLNEDIILTSNGQVEENISIEQKINKLFNENDNLNLSESELRKILRIKIKELKQEYSRLTREKKRVVRKLRWNEKALSEMSELLVLKLNSIEEWDENEIYKM